MKKLIVLYVMSCYWLFLMSTTTAIARNDVVEYTIAEALAIGKHKGVEIADVKMYFGDQAQPKILKNFGEFATNKKTNAIGKSDKFACQWVFLSALKQLALRTRLLGANTIVNIRSNYKHRIYSDKKHFQCGIGNIVAGVALKGEIVITKR